MVKGKGIWFEIFKFMAKVFKMRVYCVEYNHVKNDILYGTSKILKKVKKYVLAKTFNDAREKVRSKKSKKYDIQHIKIFLMK